MDIDAVRDIEPRLTCFAIDQGDHPPLHSQPVAHFPQGLLDLIAQLTRLRKDLCDCVQRGQFFEVMDADLFSSGCADL